MNPSVQDVNHPVLIASKVDPNPHYEYEKIEDVAKLRVARCNAQLYSVP